MNLTVNITKRKQELEEAGLGALFMLLIKPKVPLVC